MRRTILLAPWLVLACTSSAPEPGTPPPSAAPPKSDPEPSATPAESPTPTGEVDCAALRTDYLAGRAALNHCETDSDCSEMWPGLCPEGPYYIDRDASIDAVLGLEQAIMTQCSIPECEPPIELGIGHCDAGTCKPGRTPARAKRGRHHESCWDYRETWLEPRGGAAATAASVITGVTPHVAIAPAKTGTLIVEVDWPRACASCRLWISEHNSGMAQLVDGERTSTDAERNGEPVRHERIELPVTPGPYHMIGLADATTEYVLRTELLDRDGELGEVTRHGVGWQRMCEG